MTMFKDDIIDYKQMPLLIEGSSESALLSITRLESISDHVAYFNSQERKTFIWPP